MTDAPGGMPYLTRYLTVLVVATVVLTAIGYALARVLGLSVPTGALVIVPPMAGALHVGQHWGRERGAVPDGRTAWRWAGMGAMVYLALMLVLLLPMAGVLATVPGLAATLIALTVGATVLINRFFLTIGARSTVAGSGNR